MSTASLLPNGKQQFLDQNGRPLASGAVYFYVPNTTTFKTTWQDPDQITKNTNPVLLDSAGEALIYGAGQYRQVVKDVFGTTVWDELTEAPLTATQITPVPTPSPGNELDYIRINATGNAYETRTPAQVLSDIGAIGLNSLPWIVAWDNGVPGDGSDQTTALQNIINSIGSTGGSILLKGNVNFTTLNLNSKSNVKFIGLGGQNAGASEQTNFTSTALAGTARAIDARGCYGFEISGMTAGVNNGNFDGVFLDLGSTGSASSVFPHIWNLTANCQGAVGMKWVSLQGCTQGFFERITFVGRSYAVLGWNTNTVPVNSNVMTFLRCDFNPSGKQYPIIGAGIQWNFINCNWEADSTDGIGRAFQSSQQFTLVNINFIGCGFFDCTAAGTEWIVIGAGEGVYVSGCFFGGFGNSYALALGGQSPGVSGIVIVGNVFDTFSAGVSFNGTKAGGNGCRSGYLGGNIAKNGTTILVSNFNATDRIAMLPNELEYAPETSGGKYFNIGIGYPTASTGFLGDLFSSSGAIHVG